MNLKKVYKKPSGTIFKSNLGFYCKVENGYLLRLTYDEGWKYCSNHKEYSKAKYKEVSKEEYDKAIENYKFGDHSGYTSKFICNEANIKDFGVYSSHM